MKNITSLTDLYLILKPITKKSNKLKYKNSYERVGFDERIVNKEIDNSNISQLLKSKISKYIKSYYGLSLNRTVSLMKNEIESRRPVNRPVTKLKSIMDLYRKKITFDSNSGVLTIKKTHTVKKWKDNDVEALRRLYPYHTVKDLAILFNRTVDSIKYKIKSEKITK